ncbi:3-hydroxyacyl-CoA dehydrogenase NAD-binding domain-containing protein [Caldalkalibacillus salinus]|uniref:3-hydroxyacyl-CoA dehydrogenase NAD-binding domain-containing protein n=1 Tax=Caldalkalibacillus salinus TaxID=2803787 RepID=UPI00192468EB|nr:3-hydroxyacyl-CoA dehydrogenase NAD-binding domain-containing protein [Caldalkalibacillus salinus]
MSRFEQGIIVIGGGTMGRGIAQFFLQSAYPVTLVDLNKDILVQAEEDITKRLNRLEEKGRLEQGQAEQLLQHLRCSTEVEGHHGCLIIEAIVEDMAVKQKLFKQLSAAYPEDTCFASNTSSLSITELGSVVRQPERVLGMHFFNPAPLMPLVEVIKGLDTSEPLVTEIVDLLKALGKSPVVVEDTPGFIVNRVARPFYNEGLKIVSEKTANIDQMDRIMKAAGFKMGPFELQDLIGIDINFATTSSLYRAYHQEPRFRPSPLQEMMVKSKRLGRKTGKGFYNYETE